MPAYENVTFGQLTPKRQETVREKIAELWADGYNASEIAKKVRISPRSVATAMGNLSRRHVGSPRTSTRTTPTSSRSKPSRR